MDDIGSTPSTEDSDPPRTTSMTAREFLAIAEEAGLIGMWADRDDIGDSSAFARTLRKRAETRRGASVLA